MKELIKEMEAAMMAEYERAAAVHGPKHASAHEAQNVIREEADEAWDEVVQINRGLKLFWDSTKANVDTSGQARAIMEHALSAAAEYVQVAAMAYKATLGYERP